jgi:uncharacterized NAD(P)/FAD-binding protein YdhS
MSLLTVVIVGGGAAGALAAIHLAAHPAATPRKIVVVEPAAELGLGAAYGTRSPSHLLNVRASSMSALVDDPGHFLAWAQARGTGADGADFLPRMLYGRYLRDTLTQALAAGHGGEVEHRRTRADRLVANAGGRLDVLLHGGDVITADHVVLATGNAVAPFAGAPDHPEMVTDPWTAGAIDRLKHVGDVLLIGSGLTAVDVVLTLRDVGHQGRIAMVSSHGLLPESHAPGPLPSLPPFITTGAPEARSIGSAMRAARVAAERADDWRQVVDGIRPETVSLWRALPVVEQRRFLRHVSRRWEVRRSRMAPEIAAALTALRASGRLTLERGRVTRLARIGDRIEASVRSAAGARGMTFDAVVLCVGPSGDPRHHPLLADCIESGLAIRHPLGLGLVVEADGYVPDARGDRRAGMWAMGSLRRGAEWESIAVPELRIHARDLAHAILASSGAAPSSPGAGA